MFKKVEKLLLVLAVLGNFVAVPTVCSREREREVECRMMMPKEIFFDDHQPIECINGIKIYDYADVEKRFEKWDQDYLIEKIYFSNANSIIKDKEDVCKIYNDAEMYQKLNCILCKKKGEKTYLKIKLSEDRNFRYKFKISHQIDQTKEEFLKELKPVEITDDGIKIYSYDACQKLIENYGCTFLKITKENFNKLKPNSILCCLWNEQARWYYEMKPFCLFFPDKPENPATPNPKDKNRSESLLLPICSALSGFIIGLTQQLITNQFSWAKNHTVISQMFGFGATAIAASTLGGIRKVTKLPDAKQTYQTISGLIGYSAGLGIGKFGAIASRYYSKPNLNK